jgi:2-desacetyl-2-hydroxyethyl bacteriochlorophyllide A dehydrogenase
MSAAVLHGVGDVRHAEVAAPGEPGPTQLLIAVEACGICGSDLHAYRTGMLGETGRELPGGGRVFGHEIAGRIEAVGDQITRFSVGQRITGISFGGFAEYILMDVTDRSPLLLPDDMSATEAATIEPLAVAMHGVKLSGVQDGENVVVLGAGTIGLSAVQFIRATLPNCRIVVVDNSDVRLDLATAVGADEVVNFVTKNSVDAVETYLGSFEPPQAKQSWIPSRIGQADIVFDCAGAPVTIRQGTDMLRAGGKGRLVMLALYERSPDLDANAVVLKGVRLVGSFSWTADDFREAFDLVAAGTIDRSQIVTHQFGLGDATEAFQVAAGPECGRVLIVP